MDKNKFNIELKREGWNKMKSVLDKEMPVKKRKILPFFLFILLTGTVAIMIFAGIYTGINDKLKYNDTPNKVYHKHNEIKNESGHSTENKKSTPEKSIEQVLKADTGNNKLLKNKTKKSKQKTKILHKKKLNFKTEIALQKNKWSKQKKYINNRNQIDRKINIRHIKNPIKPVDFLYRQKTIYPLFDFREFAISNKKKIKIFNPYLGLKSYLFGDKKFSPKFEFSIGNNLRLTDKLSLYMGMSLAQKKILFQYVEIKSYNIQSSNDSYTEKNNRIALDKKDSYTNTSKWLFEFFLMESYKFHKAAHLEIGGGIAFNDGIAINSLRYSNNSPQENNGLSFDYEDFLPVLYADIAFSYSFFPKMMIQAGYKYYFSKTVYIKHSSTNKIYSKKLVDNYYPSRLYFGIKYFFFNQKRLSL